MGGRGGRADDEDEDENLRVTTFRRDREAERDCLFNIDIYM
jgi:hypothetical protein